MGGLDILSCSPKQCPLTAHELRVRLPCCSAREPHPQPCPGTQFWSSKPFLSRRSPSLHRRSGHARSLSCPPRSKSGVTAFFPRPWVWCPIQTARRAERPAGSLAPVLGRSPRPHPGALQPGPLSRHFLLVKGELDHTHCEAAQHGGRPRCPVRRPRARAVSPPASWVSIFKEKNVLEEKEMDLGHLCLLERNRCF